MKLGDNDTISWWTFFGLAVISALALAALGWGR